MDNLVFLKTQDLNEEPFTTSEVIAQYGGVKHHAIQNLILNHIDDLKEFGQVAFQMRAVENNGTKFEKVYDFNEDQATLLITFMKNTPQVVQFKKNLVRQFRAMINELNKRAITRAIVKEGRKVLTDTLREKYPESKWIYKHYTDLDYKCVLGMTAKKFEQTYNIPNGKIRDYIQADQLQQVGIIEAAEKSLTEAGYDYHEIKDILSRKFIDRKTG
jgi:phage regulator Rha-like protein